MTTTRDRMDGGEFQTIREYLGLTADVLAGILKVGARTIRAWESGRDPIPTRSPTNSAPSRTTPAITSTSSWPNSVISRRRTSSSSIDTTKTSPPTTLTRRT